MSSANGGEPTFTDRARALLDEGRAEIQRLDERHAELLNKREAEVAAVRERYAKQLAEVVDERKLLTRLERAFDPTSAKQGRSKGKAPGAKRTRTGDVSAKTREVTLRVMLDGCETVVAIGEGIGMSRQTAFNAVDQMREEGLVRLAGEGQNGAKLFRLTARGREAAEAARVAQA